MPHRRTQLARAATAFAVTLIIVLGSSDAAYGPASGQQANLKDIMQTKLEHGQGLLRAVVLGETAAVQMHANQLTLLSEASTWTPLRTPEYLRYASDFRETATQLRDEAENRNMERVAFAYSELVTTCVQCHRHVRGAKTAN